MKRGKKWGEEKDGDVYRGASLTLSAGTGKLLEEQAAKVKRGTREKKRETPSQEHRRGGGEAYRFSERVLTGGTGKTNQAR